jgi:non-specific serine/threonine protein kinase
MSAYILSYDLLRRFKNGSLKDQVTARGIKTLILDECQQIKNPASQRTVSCREIADLVPHVMALSGTPIRNHAGEYFPVLNMVAPERYSNYNLFVRRDLDSYHTRFGYKIGGLRDPEGFLHKNADIIFRKTRAEVLPELPTIDRHNQFCDLGKEVEKQYIETFRKFQNEYNSAETMAAFERQANILAFLSKMRHLTGLSKINPCIDFCMEFLGGTDRKLTIFLHHKDVMEILKQRLGELLTELDLNPPATLEAGDSASEIVTKFNNDPRSRILLASTLASGEGVDGLQRHSDLIILERQWNPMNEEQVEGRFSRIGGQTEFKSVTATYFIAIGTVDEFFTELVERKREIVYSTLDGRAIEWDQSSLIMELAEAMAVSGGKQWGI